MNPLLASLGNWWAITNDEKTTVETKDTGININQEDDNKLSDGALLARIQAILKADSATQRKDTVISTNDRNDLPLDRKIQEKIFQLNSLYYSFATHLELAKQTSMNPQQEVPLWNYGTQSIIAALQLANNVLLPYFKIDIQMIQMVYDAVLLMERSGMEFSYAARRCSQVGEANLVKCWTSAGHALFQAAQKLMKSFEAQCNHAADSSRKWQLAADIQKQSVDLFYKAMNVSCKPDRVGLISTAWSNAALNMCMAADMIGNGIEVTQFVEKSSVYSKLANLWMHSTLYYVEAAVMYSKSNKDVTEGKILVSKGDGCHNAALNLQRAMQEAIQGSSDTVVKDWDHAAELHCRSFHSFLHAKEAIPQNNQDKKDGKNMKVSDMWSKTGICYYWAADYLRQALQSEQQAEAVGAGQDNETSHKYREASKLCEHAIEAFQTSLKTLDDQNDNEIANAWEGIGVAYQQAAALMVLPDPTDEQSNQLANRLKEVEEGKRNMPITLERAALIEQRNQILKKRMTCVSGKAHIDRRINDSTNDFNDKQRRTIEQSWHGCELFYDKSIEMMNLALKHCGPSIENVNREMIELYTKASTLYQCSGRWSWVATKASSNSKNSAKQIGTASTYTHGAKQLVELINYQQNPIVLDCVLARECIPVELRAIVQSFFQPSSSNVGLNKRDILKMVNSLLARAKSEENGVQQHRRRPSRPRRKHHHKRRNNHNRRNHRRGGYSRRYDSDDSSDSDFDFLDFDSDDDSYDAHDYDVDSDQEREMEMMMDALGDMNREHYEMLQEMHG